MEVLHMKKGICFGSLPGSLSVEDRFKLAKDAGFDGVEIGTVGKADGKAMKKAAEAAGVQIPSIMGGVHWQFPLSSPDKSVREKCVEGISRAIDLATEVGADTVLLVPGVVNDQVRYEDAYKRSQKEVKRLAKKAEKAKVFIGIENVWNKFLLSPMEFCKFVDDVGSEYVQAYFDVGNILLYGYPQHWIQSLGKRIKKVHLKDFQLSSKSFVWLLEGDVPWAEVRAALKKIKYQDFLTAELPGYPHYPTQMVYDTSAHIDRIIAGE